jgi:hypothetical protein
MSRSLKVVSRKPRSPGFRTSYATADGPDIGPHGTRPERVTYGDAVLVDRLRAPIARLNGGPTW